MSLKRISKLTIQKVVNEYNKYLGNPEYYEKFHRQLVDEGENPLIWQLIETAGSAHVNNGKLVASLMTFGIMTYRALELTLGKMPRVEEGVFATLGHQYIDTPMHYYESQAKKLKDENPKLLVLCVNYCGVGEVLSDRPESIEISQTTLMVGITIYRLIEEQLEVEKMNEIRLQ